ncbi:DUF4056 domain-containing protein [Vibrio kasasachensis]|uniref:DUF4056 domain-containing protein n=1 Tax=Vibrio kasasachensis TaxID=2910248 RepID=UPI003D147746
MKKTVLLVLSLCSSWVHSQELKAPIGVRPCCAFGMDLKAQLGSVPVPFFSLENVLDSSDIGTHHYNDGSESVSGSLLGFNDEMNGIIFTQQGGFIDTAHVRDTADNTYYLFQLNRDNLGKSTTVDFPSELRVRRVEWFEQDMPFTGQERIQRSAQAAALIAYRMAQWHEIAQWFGMVSVSGFKEFASAFSSEDLYSNMLGALLAEAILLEQPDICQDGFSKAMDVSFQQALMQLKVQPKSVTREKMKQLDGKWWDSSRRLPDKWVVLFRDYHLALNLTPNFPESTTRLNIDERFSDQQSIEDWVQLELHVSDKEKSFSELPESLKSMPVWRSAQFQLLADFAQAWDTRIHPHN